MDRKTEIIHTATSLFNEKGYTTVTMREIAKEIGIKAASLYNHIESKQEILTIMAMEVADNFTSGMKTINSKETNTVAKLEQIIVLYIDTALKNPERMESLEKNWIYLEGENLDYYRQLRHQFEENLRQIIKEGIKLKFLKDVNSEISLNFLLYTLRSVNKWYPYKKNIDQELLKKDLLTLLMRGMEAKNQ